MESVSAWEYNKIVNELIQGMEKAKQLRFHLCSTSPSEAQDSILQRIISSYEKALFILKWDGSSRQVEPGPSMVGPLESSVSFDGSPRSEDLHKNFVETSKKRKLQPTWSEQVKVSSENGLEGPSDDGYSWRKYGQKDILGAKYPRSYYRCTYRPVQNCWATKQVQRSDDDPTLFDITYKGKHTCNQSAYTIPPQKSPEKQKPKFNPSHNYQVQEQNPNLLSFKSNLRVHTEDLDKNEMPTHFSFPSNFAFHAGENHYSPQFLSPATSESNYYSTGNYQMQSYERVPNLQNSETDYADIISGHASTNNSPIAGMEFSINHVDQDPYFPFDAPGFFTY